MLSDAISSVRGYLTDRLVSPLSGSFIVAWSIWNYEVYVILFSDMDGEGKINYINNILFGSPESKFYDLFFWPLFFSAIYIFIYPFPNKFVFSFNKMRQVEMNRRRQEIEGEVLLSVEEGRRLREYYLERIQKLEKGKEDRDRDIQILQKKNSELEDQIIEKSNAIARIESKITDIDEGSFIDIPRDLAIKNKLINNKWRLFFNKSRGVAGSKIITFLADGDIGLGRNHNEYKWKTEGSDLFLIREDGNIHNIFSYNENEGKFFSTNSNNVRAVMDGFKDQYISVDD